MVIPSCSTTFRIFESVYDTREQGFSPISSDARKESSPKKRGVVLSLDLLQLKKIYEEKDFLKKQKSEQPEHSDVDQVKMVKKR